MYFPLSSSLRFLSLVLGISPSLVLGLSPSLVLIVSFVAVRFHHFFGKMGRNTWDEGETCPRRMTCFARLVDLQDVALYKVKRCREQVMDLATKGIRLATDRMERDELEGGDWVGREGQGGGDLEEVRAQRVEEGESSVAVG